MAASPPHESPALALGIDLGGTNVKAALHQRDGSVVERWAEPTLDALTPQGQPAWLETVRMLAARARDKFGAFAMGAAAPGLARADGGGIAFMPGRLQGLAGLDWTHALESPAPVQVLNDAHAALLGEVWRGAARGRRHAIMLTLGTGVGGAVFADGRLLRGAIGRAGHLGHLTVDFRGAPDICNTPGSLEDAIGECTLQARGGGRFASTRQLAEAAAAGDAGAMDIWLASLRALAAGIASLANILDFEVAVIGGGITKAGPLLFDNLERELRRVEWRPGGHQIQIAPAQLGEWAGACGAAANALGMDFSAG